MVQNISLFPTKHSLQVSIHPLAPPHSSQITCLEVVTDENRYQALIRQYQSEIAANITLEQGKTHADAMGDVFRGLQVVDTTTAIPTLLKGEAVEVAKDMDTQSIRNPLGVAAAICPFNFPAMSE